jgi:hypothetical protein
MNQRYVRDLAERVIATYLEAFIGLLLLEWTDVMNAGALLSTGRSAAYAAAPTALAVIKGALARGVHDPGTASLVDVTPPVG